MMAQSICIEPLPGSRLAVPRCSCRAEEIARPVLRAESGVVSSTESPQAGAVAEIENPEEVGHESLRSRLNMQLVIEHMEDAERDMRSHDSKGVAGCCLKNHVITPTLRSRMVNWIMEVMDVYDCCDQTFFLTVLMLDNYYAKHAR